MNPCRASHFVKWASPIRISFTPKPVIPRSCYYATVSVIDSKPPIALNGLDGTYASALYTAAVKNQCLDSTARAINGLKNLFKRDPKLAIVLQAPSLNSGDKSAIIAELQKHTEEPDKQNIVRNFMGVLAEYNRLGLIPNVCEKFGTLISAARGEVEVNVTSATQLDNKTLNRLETAVSKSSFIGQGKKLRIKNTVNRDIIGGLVVEVGDRTIDLSISNRVAKLNKLLTDTL